MMRMEVARVASIHIPPVEAVAGAVPAGSHLEYSRKLNRMVFVTPDGSIVDVGFGGSKPEVVHNGWTKPLAE